MENDDNFDPILVWSLSGCNDYTGTAFQQDVKRGGDASMFPPDYKTEDYL